MEPEAFLSSLASRSLPRPASRLVLSLALIVFHKRKVLKRDCGGNPGPKEDQEVEWEG